MKFVIIFYSNGSKRKRNFEPQRECVSEMSKTPYEIRWARPEDWEAAINLVWKTFMEFEAPDYSDEGIINFKDFLTDGMIYRMFLDGNYPMFVAEDDGKIVGVVSVRNRNRISLLFVDAAYHKQGIGSALVERMNRYLKEEKRELYVTVMAAPYAVDFYRTIGFHACAPEEQFAGIRVTSMEKIF